MKKATPGWRPNFRGLGSVRKLVVSGMGCANRGLGCAGCSLKKTCSGLGDDTGIDPATGLSYQYEQIFGTSNPAAGGNAPLVAPPGTYISTTGQIVASNPNPFILPGQMAAPVYPSTPLPGNPNLSIVPGAPSGIVYNSSTQAYQPMPSAASLALGGLSTTEILIGALALGGAVLLASRRR